MWILQTSFGSVFGSMVLITAFVGVKDFGGVGTFYARASRGQTTSS
jgi:hypothetical protein